MKYNPKLTSETFKFNAFDISRANSCREIL